MRYISGGSDEQLERFSIPIKSLTAERKAIPNAARKYTAAVSGKRKKCKNKTISIIIKFENMIKYIELNNDEFEKACNFIRKTNNERKDKMFIQMNRKTYGGLITLEGTLEEIENLCFILKDNGIVF